MYRLLALGLVLVLVGAPIAQELGNRAPVKVPGTYPENIPNPDLQGGDTIASALLIPGPLPYSDSGTTAGYHDDYDEVCPYTGSLAPDVVYRYVPTAAQAINVDMCNSGFDTKVYVYDAGLNLVACNDDFYFGAPCHTYSSKVENVAMNAGQTYYIIVDGYGGDSGEYVMDVTEFVPCAVACPNDADHIEGEPPLVDDYVDNWNGGCNTSPGYPFQHVGGCWPDGTAMLCGVSGWYLSAGSQIRDTDWFTLTKGGTANIEVTADAEYASYIFELGGTCAGGVAVVQQAIAGPCLEATMSIPGAAFSTKWFWVGPTVFADPDGGDNMYDYVVWFTGLQIEIGGCGSIATEAANWGGIKALYR